jgi:hypothetical protein
MRLDSAVDFSLKGSYNIERREEERGEIYIERGEVSEMNEKWLVVHDKSGQGLWAFNLAEVVRIRLTVQHKEQWRAVLVLSFRDGTVWLVYPNEPAETAEEAYASALPVFRRIVAMAATTESNLVEVGQACLQAEKIP